MTRYIILAAIAALAIACDGPPGNGWATPRGHARPAPGAPDCLSKPELLGCSDLEDEGPDTSAHPPLSAFGAVEHEAIATTSDKHGPQGANTPHQAGVSNQWWERDACGAWPSGPWDCYKTAWPQRGYSSAWIVTNTTSRWWFVQKIYVIFGWDGQSIWDTYAPWTAQLCLSGYNWCFDVTNAARGTASRSVWFDVGGAQYFVPPGAAQVWQLNIYLQPGYDLGAMPKMRVSVSAGGMRYLDGP